MRTIHGPTLISLALTGLLLIVGLVRVVSYAGFFQDSWLGLLAYDNSSYFSAQYFKILATPFVISGVYYLFRLFNKGHQDVFPDPQRVADRRIDFKSPWLRFVLVTIVSLHWLILEPLDMGSKRLDPSFPHYSSEESVLINVAVFLVSAVISFFAMKYLSFEPLFKRETG